MQTIFSFPLQSLELLFYHTAAGVLAVWRPWNVSPYFSIVQILFSFPLRSLGPLWYLFKWSSAHVYASGHKQCCEHHYCLWRFSIKPRTPFLTVMCSLFPTAIFYTFIVRPGSGRFPNLNSETLRDIQPARAFSALIYTKCNDALVSDTFHET